MKTIMHSKRGGKGLIIGGLLVWLAAIDFVLIAEPLGAVVVHGIGAFVLLIIAAFIPERSECQFVSRESVLTGMGLMVYMSLSRIPIFPMFPWVLGSIWWELVWAFAPIVFAWGSYRLALFAYVYFQQDPDGEHQAEQDFTPSARPAVSSSGHVFPTLNPQSKPPPHRSDVRGMDVRLKSMKNTLFFLSALLLMSCTQPPSSSGDDWLNWTRKRLDDDPRIKMLDKVLWLTTENGDKVPFLDGHLITSIDGRKTEREFTMSFRMHNGKWVLESAGFDGSQPGDERLNHILANIYGRDEFIRAGMLLDASSAHDEKDAVSKP